MDYLDTRKWESSPVEEPTRDFGVLGFMFLLEISEKKETFYKTAQRAKYFAKSIREVIVTKIWIAKETAADKRTSAPHAGRPL